MVVPFEGFVVPPLFHTAFLVVGVAAVLAVLYELRPPVTERVSLALAPWMSAGAALHVLYQLGLRFDAQVYAPVIEPLFSAPAVYLTTFLATGVVWILATIVEGVTGSDAENKNTVARYLGGVGTAVLLTLVVLVLLVEMELSPEPLAPLLPVIGLLVSLGVAALVYFLVGLWRTYVVAEARWVGGLVVFAHVFDGVTTAIGVDIVGAGERSALPARIMEFAAGLPTAPYLGSGWLFVVVKVAVAVAVVVLFADFVREEPTRANLTLAAIAAVGLGPATNNFLLFMLG